VHRRLLRRTEAAQYLRDKYNIPCEASSLRTLACKGTGPAFQKCGRYPLYDEPDLDSFALAKMSPKVRSTSELTARRAASSGKRTRKLGEARYAPA
jgi:hypothetical protein